MKAIQHLRHLKILQAFYSGDEIIFDIRDLLETSQYIKDLSNRWVTFDGQTVISCADHFCLKE